MDVSLGRIVLYTLTDEDADQINARQVTGAGIEKGNPVEAGKVLPMIVTAIWPNNVVNGQVFLDGNHSLWVTSVSEGTGPRSWAWPVKAETKS